MNCHLRYKSVVVPILGPVSQNKTTCGQSVPPLHFQSFSECQVPMDLHGCSTLRALCLRPVPPLDGNFTPSPSLLR
jgi:hypothetical protein